MDRTRHLADPFDEMSGPGPVFRPASPPGTTADDLVPDIRRDFRSITHRRTSHLRCSPRARASRARPSHRPITPRLGARVPGWPGGRGSRGIHRPAVSSNPADERTLLAQGHRVAAPHPPFYEKMPGVNPHPTRFSWAWRSFSLKAVFVLFHSDRQFPPPRVEARSSSPVFRSATWFILLWRFRRSVWGTSSDDGLGTWRPILRELGPARRSSSLPA